MRKNPIAPTEQLKQRELLTVAEASAVFGYSLAFIYKKIEEGSLSLTAGRLSQDDFKKAWKADFPVENTAA